MTGPHGDGEDDTRHHELVIIRRISGGDDAAHHGGVWKIAHADFMTALMAFFLVMWLINLTDEKTISGVANYFNPIRLTDSAAKPKGIFTMEPDSEERGPPKPDKHSEAKKAKAPEKSADAALFSEPYEALDKIAAQAGKGKPELAITERGNVPAHHTGEAFRDPFDPDSRYELAHQAEGDEPSGIKNNAGTDAPTHDPSEAVAAKAPETADARGIEDLKKPIEEAVKSAGFADIPGIEVRSTEEGLLVSITDQPNFEMFRISSAQPKPELVVLMERIGKVLLPRPEHIVIRGHTDARPFRPGGYDNWRLSSARAQMAYYMLTRSGVPDVRIDRIEGHADHDLKIAGSPLAAENRRIEILLLKGRS